MNKIAVVDYGVGNLFSLVSSFKAVGADITVVSDVEKLKNYEKIVLPGVGAFADAAKKLRDTGADACLNDEVRKGKPLIGICLGMQLLFDESYEYGKHAGLGLIGGVVRPISEVVSKNVKIPHIGWNALCFPKNREKSELFKYINEGDCVYFVHSFFADNCSEAQIATVEYEASLTAAVAKDNIYGCQFHPEKSGSVGLNILRAFCEIK